MITKEQITASRDYNYSLRWVQRRHGGETRTKLAKEHMLYVCGLWDSTETFKVIWDLLLKD